MVIAEAEMGGSLLEAGRWTEACAALESALRKEPSPEVLVGLAEANWWTGDILASIEYSQRAYSAFRGQGDSVNAAMAAFAVALNYKCCLGNAAAARGWLARAETAAQEGDPTPVQGWLWVLNGYLTADHDLELALQFARQALDHAAVTADRDLELMARADLGAMLAAMGRVEEGLRLIDESMAGVSAGEHKHLNTLVFVCCIMLGACEMTCDFERASQWTRVADSFMETYGCPFLYAECRTLYGGLLTAKGRYAAAERELKSAVKITDGVYPSIHVLALANLADLKLRQGLIEEAENLLAGIEHELPAGLPLAAIKLARGEASVALALVERTLRTNVKESTASIRALEMAVAANLALGRKEAALAMLKRLRAAAGHRDWPEASARASTAAGWLARGQLAPTEALSHFEQATQCFSRLGLPLEGARARLAVAEIAAVSDPELAKVEAQGAFDAFDELGAQADADTASALLRSLGVPSRPGPKRLSLLTKREEEVLNLLSKGLSNPEIADRLVISRKTASHHVSSLLAKLSVRNRAEAAALATRTAEIS